VTDVTDRLARHLETWLGAWPPAPGRLTVVGAPQRLQPGWDGKVHSVVGVATPDGAVLSVPPDRADDVRRLGDDLDAIAAELPAAVGRPGGRYGSGTFRWTGDPADLEPAGEWVSRDDPRVPPWLLPFNGDVLIAWDDDGGYGAGVGRKQHDQHGHELAVVTEEQLRGRGLARRLVVTAARRVLDDGAVPTYLHDDANVASARVADASGFPDRGWRILGVWGGEPEGTGPPR
jgi:GNAT superfamily N-acetyltransferase